MQIRLVDVRHSVLNPESNIACIAASCSVWNPLAVEPCLHKVQILVKIRVRVEADVGKGTVTRGE